MTPTEKQPTPFDEAKGAFLGSETPAELLLNFAKVQALVNIGFEDPLAAQRELVTLSSAGATSSRMAKDADTEATFNGMRDGFQRTIDLMEAKSPAKKAAAARKPAPKPRTVPKAG